MVYQQGRFTTHAAWHQTLLQGRCAGEPCWPGYKWPCPERGPCPWGASPHTWIPRALTKDRIRKSSPRLLSRKPLHEHGLGCWSSAAVLAVVPPATGVRGPQRQGLTTTPRGDDKRDHPAGSGGRVCGQGDELSTLHFSQNTSGLSQRLSSKISTEVTQECGKLG